VGAVLIAGAGVGITALPASLAYREWGTAFDIGLTMVLMAGVGGSTMAVAGRPERLRPKDAFAGVAFAWVAVIAMGSLPYLLTGSFSTTDALFESAAGFTTTGATIITDLPSVARGLLMWRVTTQWFGGMGIIVLSIAVLPFVGAGGLQLARAETTGPDSDRLTPRLRGTALRLWALYAVLTVVAAIALALGDMTPFEAIVHALSTMSTGGFGTEPTSLAEFSAYSQWVVIAFMVVAGVSFTLHIRALRKPSLYATTPEARYYAVSLLIGGALVVGGLSLEATGVPIREALFTAIATITGTGFAVADYARWPAAIGGTILMLMFLGGMGGSTTGALKTYRVAVVLKSAASEVRRFTRPRSVSITRFGRTPVPNSVVSSVHAYVVVYLLAFGIGMLLLLFAEAAWGDHMDLVSGLSAAASAIGNVGPGLGSVGPAETYAAVSAPGKWILGMLMILGRLEIYPVVLLFTASFWRK
jgi:trk system potassium uptake protein TrkH